LQLSTGYCQAAGKKGACCALGFAMEMGIDLGTASVLVFVKGKGIVLNEPSVVAVEKDSRKVIAIGEEARRMVGKTPGNIVAIRPLRDGVIADYDITEAMLKYFIRSICGSRTMVKPRVVVCVPSGCTAVEKRAVTDAAVQAGSRKTDVIEEPLAAALGAGLDILQPRGHAVVDIGGGTTDIAVLSLGGIVLSESIRTGGDKFDEAIIRYIKRVYNLLIGERTAEEVKISIGTAIPGINKGTFGIRGRDLMSGLPKTVEVTSQEISEALAEPIEDIIATLKYVLERTPPELAGDIAEHGVVMTGGGSLLHDFDVRITRETGVPVIVADDPISCVAKGAGRALEEFETVASNWVPLKRAGAR